jgi:hypothetical protein
MCDCKMIRKDGTAPPTMGTKGWIYTIKRNEFGWWSLLINHKGEQEEIPIAYCPICGRELK